MHDDRIFRTLIDINFDINVFILQDVDDGNAHYWQQ